LSHITRVLPCWLTVEDGWVRTLAVETALQLDADHPDFDEFAVADLMREASALQEKGGLSRLPANPSRYCAVLGSAFHPLQTITIRLPCL